MLGLIVTSPKGNKFYFSEADIGKDISARGSKYIQLSRKYLVDFYTNMISLNEILELAGAKIVREKKDLNIDLSPESLEKDTIIKLCS